jgi:hypothetical protein
MVLKLFRLKSGIPVWFLILVFFLYACSPLPTSVPKPAATPTITGDVVHVSEPTLFPTSPTPTETPEPLPEVALLLYPPGSDHRYAEEIIALLDDILFNTQIEPKVVHEITREDLGKHVKLVIATGPIEYISELISVSPATQFVAIGANEVAPQNNLSILSTDSPKVGQQAFIAGVIAAIITSDWRIGVISKDEISSQAFVNGGIYFCGLCRQVYPPFYDQEGKYIKFPLHYILPPGAGEMDWQTAANYMIERGVKTVYIPAEAHNPNLLDALENADVNIIGAIPNTEERANWIATIHLNPVESLREILPNLLQGKGGSQIQMSLEISEINPDLFSSARLNVAQTILEDLEAGFIITGVDQTH